MQAPFRQWSKQALGWDVSDGDAGDTGDVTTSDEAHDPEGSVGGALARLDEADRRHGPREHISASPAGPTPA